MELILLPMLLLAGLLTTMDSGDESPNEDTDDAHAEGSSADQEFGVGDILDLGEDQTIVSPIEDADVVSDVSSEGDASDQYLLSGGPDDDTILSDEQDEVTVSGGLGSDLFILSELIDTVEEAFVESPRRMVISDFDINEDTLGVVIESENLQGISISTDFDPESNATEVLVNQRFDGAEPSSAVIASFRLEGVDHFDASGLRFFLGDELTPLEFDFLFSNELDGNSPILSGVHP